MNTGWFFFGYVTGLVTALIIIGMVAFVALREEKKRALQPEAKG